MPTPRRPDPSSQRQPTRRASSHSTSSAIAACTGHSPIQDGIWPLAIHFLASDSRFAKGMYTRIATASLPKRPARGEVYASGTASALSSSAPSGIDTRHCSSARSPRSSLAASCARLLARVRSRGASGSSRARSTPWLANSVTVQSERPGSPMWVRPSASTMYSSPVASSRR